MNRRAALRELLLSYGPSDDVEEAHRAAMLDLLESSDDPFSSVSFEPGHFTASAFVLDPAGRDLLLIDHRRLGKWLQPGGHIDPDDSGPQAAAMREAAEETGAGPFSPVRPGIFDLDVHPIPAKASEPPHLHFDVRFLFRAARRDLSPDLSEVGGARWVTPTAVEHLTDDASVRRAVAKLAGG